MKNNKKSVIYKYMEQHNEEIAVKKNEPLPEKFFVGDEDDFNFKAGKQLILC